MVSPLFLLADSTPLFMTAAGERPLLQRVADHLPAPAKAAYLGAANGDDPNYYEIFCAATDKIGISQRRHIAHPYQDEACGWLREADLILLSGGDVMRGWNCFASAAIQDLLKQRYQQGAVLMGISAGAIHLSDYLFGEDGDTATSLQRGMGLFHGLVDVHDQDRQWCRLKHLATLVEPGTHCIGIPSNGVVQVSPRQELTASGAPLIQWHTS